MQNCGNPTRQGLIALNGWWHRLRAHSRRALLPVPPAASAVNGHSGPSWRGLPRAPGRLEARFWLYRHQDLQVLLFSKRFFFSLVYFLILFSMIRHLQDNPTEMLKCGWILNHFATFRWDFLDSCKHSWICNQHQLLFAEFCEHSGCGAVQKG